MKESQESVTKEMWYQGQKTHADLIKGMDKRITKLIEIVEQLIKDLK